MLFQQAISSYTPAQRARNIARIQRFISRPIPGDDVQTDPRVQHQAQLHAAQQAP
jgi:hypothetical protein